jgi:error-prone DNA polymerase
LIGPGSGYAELHAHSCYSLGDGVPFPDELAERAAALGLAALALTDHDALYGVVPFVARAKEVGLKAIIGSEVTLDDDSHLTLLAEDQAGYANLCALITAGRLNAPKGQARLPFAELAAHTAGLIALSGCRRGRTARAVLARDEPAAASALRDLLDLFGRRQLYIEVQRNRRKDDLRLSRRLSELARNHGLHCVATGNVHYLTAEDADLQDVLVSVRERAPLARARPVLRPNHEYVLRSPAAMRALYPDLPQAVTNTLAIAERCAVTLPAGLQVLPQFPTPEGLSADDYLRRLCAAELPGRYARILPRASAWLERELAVIARLGLANYFLVIWDIIRFCQREHILVHGRGSAANSLVAHLLGISAIDPIAHDLVPERFFSVEHGATPDVDLDLPSGEQRERVIQYIYDRYGREHAAMACTYLTRRSASALRDVGFALGFKPETLEPLARELDGGPRTADRGSPLAEDDDALHDGGRPTADRRHSSDSPLPSAVHGLSSIRPSSVANLYSLTDRLRRRPRHLGLHNGGMIVSGQPLARLIPLEPATMAGRTVVQWDKEWLEAAGLVKIDLLGLRTLAALAETVALIAEHHGKHVDLHRLDFRDPRVYAQICSGHTIGLFQVESGAQASLIPHLQPRTFHDLIIQVSLIRPGPLQGNMVRPYLRRRNGQEPVTYLHPLLKPALQETLGVIVFQEQVLKVARDFAGFTPGRGEQLRRALGGKHPDEALEHFRAEFIRGALTNGATRDVAFQVWRMLKGFGGYSFSKAHAAAFACLVYWCAWLRVYHPAEYFCGLLRHAPLGSYRPDALEAEARRIGLRFRPFDINRSSVQPTLESGEIRHGLKDVCGLGAEGAAAIVAARGAEPFRSLADFITRTRLSERRLLESLILAGACDALKPRRQLLWELAEALQIAQRPQPALPLFDSPDERLALPAMTPAQQTAATFAATGYTVDVHLTRLKQDAFTRAGCLSLPELKKAKLGAVVRVGGLVMDGLRRPPTAGGVSFVRLESDECVMDVIVPVEVYAQDRDPLRRSLFLVVEGVLQRQWPTVTVLARRVVRLAE